MGVVKEILEAAEFVVDSQGQKRAVLLDYSLWKELLTILEDIEDAEEIRHLREMGEEAIPWEKALVDTVFSTT